MGSYLKTIHSQWATLDIQEKRASVKRKPNCPFACGHLDSNEHVLRCPRSSNKILRQTLIGNLIKALKEWETPVEIKTALLQGITLWMGFENVQGSQLHDAAFRQEEMGWEHMFCGRINVEWTKWINNESRRTAWNKAILTVFIEWSRAAWKLRCTEQHQHAHTFVGSTVYEHMKLIYNLQATYQLADKILFKKNPRATSRVLTETKPGVDMPSAQFLRHTPPTTIKATELH